MQVDFDKIRLDINNNSYHFIGSGSGRLVYDLDNGYVVKRAKNKKGFAQNKAEYRIASKDHSNIFAEVIAVSEDFTYLIMQKAERIDDISYVWNYFNVKSNRELFRLDEFKNLTSQYNLLLPDLCRKNSWGIVNGRPMIIDFGFTREVNKLYSFF
jgi:hypothetical protein